MAFILLIFTVIQVESTYNENDLVAQYTDVLELAGKAYDGDRKPYEIVSFDDYTLGFAFIDTDYNIKASFLKSGITIL